MTLSELAMKNDLVTSAGVYKEGRRKSEFCGAGGMEDETGEGLIIKNCLSFKQPRNSPSSRYFKNSLLANFITGYQLCFMPSHLW